MDTAISYQTLHRNTVKYMLTYVQEYESIKKGEHPDFKFVKDFFQARAICPQNFYKFHRRYLASGRNDDAFLPRKRGPRCKYYDLLPGHKVLVEKVLEYRQNGSNKFAIAAALRQDPTLKGPCSASTVYRIFVAYGVNRLMPPQKEEKRKIMRAYAGSLIHVDCHALPKGVVAAFPQDRFYVLGAVDDFSRLCWTEVIKSPKALEVTFAMMDVILIFYDRYGFKGEEVLTDNGSEFCGGQKTLESHPYERLLIHFGIKHRKTQPYRPQTNGKVERFWRSFHEDVIEGTEFQTVEELKEAILGYNLYYNEHRPHQGIEGKTPLEKLRGSSGGV